MKPAIAYYRVSTQRQGRSGLGLEAQQTALARFADAEHFTIASSRSYPACRPGRSPRS
jgi:DNA invertase Pin-like site-specific DNA recombinase